MHFRFAIAAVLYYYLTSCYVRCFPSGAPHESCETLSPERGHKAPSQPVQYAPFSVVATARNFEPGERIGVEIFQRDSRENFKGFMVQALDAYLHQPIGQFVPTHGMKLLRECAAVSHSDSRPKKAVNLVWQAPPDHSGEVIFRATIVQSKELYYANILAHNAQEYYFST
ncbi:putative ferric-chelate reductase 1-like protein [Dinothrombium tinctorium]|uniref:Putative ferric-chelate reductase 1-like protein n=1 Tax=Dinothrombium tinctorium TaxID=1965070 RepID=A0A3S4RLD8_9ACAR|nr:putative ferric-chelate reductase 1-like protein [Dinothrombium tinctorium]RWS17622.1 putative ferric-chelate reductase 1-like protein [Dinothrombium tinctorium]